MLNVNNSIDKIKKIKEADTETLKMLTDSFGSLGEAQFNLEYASLEQGVYRFARNLERSTKDGTLSQSSLAAPLLQTLVNRTYEVFEERIAALPVRSELFKIKDILDIDICINVVVSSVIKWTTLMNDDANPVTVAKAVGAVIEKETFYSALREDNKGFWDAVIANGLNKRNKSIYKEEYLKAVTEITRDNFNVSWDIWEEDIKFTLGFFLINILADTGIVNIVNVKLNNVSSDRLNLSNKTVYSMHLSPEIKDRLLERADLLSLSFSAYKPMVIKPKRWTNIIDGGYYVDKIHKPKLIKNVYTKKKFKKYNDNKMPKVLEAANIIQEVPYKINSDILVIINSLLTHNNVAIEDFPQLNHRDKPIFKDNFSAEELKEYKREMVKFYIEDSRRKGKRMALLNKVNVANEFKDYDSIYFPVTYDTRGRLYFSPQFNPQGDDLQKALLTFSTGKALGKNGLKWLKIHGANCAAMTTLAGKTDKITIKQRIDWVDANMSMILDCAKSPLDNQFWMQADSPFMFLAFCFEMKKAHEQGESYVCSLPVSIDGSCSGTQHFSCMVRDESGGEATNLVPMDKVNDIYGMVASECTKRLEDLSNDDIKGFAAKQWLAYGITRSTVKRPVMTLPYGSNKLGFCNQLREDVIAPEVRHNANSPLVDLKATDIAVLANTIYDSISTVTSSTLEVLNWLQQTIKPLGKDTVVKGIEQKAQAIEWHTVSDNFLVIQDYKKEGTKRGKLVLGGRIFRPQLGNGDFTIDANKQRNGISPNFVHSYDANHLREIVRRANTAGINSLMLIHDSFGCLPSDMEDLARITKESMRDIYLNHNVLLEFQKEIKSKVVIDYKFPEIPKFGNLDLNKIPDTLYSFI